MAAFFVLVLFASLAAASSTQLDASAVQQEIQQKGAKEAAQVLYANRPSWAALTRLVRTGKSEWIDIAVGLRTGTDGGASSELQDSLFAALATNPNHVLRVVDPVVPVSVLCSGRSDPLPTAKAAISEIDRIRKAVEGVHDRNLSEKRKDCLNALEDAKSSTKRFFND